MKKKTISPNTDARNIAVSQDHEVAYVCKHWSMAGKNLAKNDLKKIIKNLSIGKHTVRSREKIYIVLKGMGYTYKR